MQQVPRRRPHRIEPAGQFSGPDPDRHEHDVGRGEAGDGQGPDQSPPRLIPRGGQGLHVEGHQAVAEGFDGADHPRRVIPRADPGQAQSAGRHVDPARGHGRIAGQDGFDQPNAGAALQPINREREFMGPIGLVGDEAGQVSGFGGFRPRRALIGVKDTALVIGPEAQGPHRVKGDRTAGAAEAPAGGRRLAAMGAWFGDVGRFRGVARHPGCRGPQFKDAHGTCTRRVTVRVLPSVSAVIRTSH